MNSYFSIKSLQYYLLVFLTVALFFASKAQSVSLPQECKFKIGDDMIWANPSISDADWDIIQLGASRKDTTIKENIFEWYRIKIIVPSCMKALAEKGKGILLKLGRIDDIDQTFFNGKLIGQSGSFPPNYQSQYQAERLYIIPLEDILWDKENLIAVRVFSPDSWVGMYQGPYTFAPVQWSDFISIQRSITQTANNGFITKIKLTNNNAEAFAGTINYRIADKIGKKMVEETMQVEIPAVKGAQQEMVFSDYVPVDESIFKLSYRIKEKTGTAYVTDEQIYLADMQIKIKVAEDPKPMIVNKVKDVFISVPFQNQTQNGYLGKRMIQNLEERLLNLDEEGVLDGYIPRPGHHPWAGEHIGKYLETASNVWKNISNNRLKMQMDRLMYQLINTQLPDGYLGTYSQDEYWTSWDVWSHKYNLYGLLAYYKATGYQPALEACKKMGDLLCKTFGNNPGQRDIIKSGTHIGMAATSVLDPMVELYRYTGDKKYLDFCYYIVDAWEQPNGPKIISSLLATGKVTKVGNGKSYEMLSNFVGLANLYRVTGDSAFLKPVLIAWHDIVDNRLYITGTTSTHEYFTEEEMFPAGTDANMGEGCVTTTWIQFNQQLLAITGDLKYMERIEKTIYNQLLGSENPETGCVSYYTPLMGKKPYSCDISCCTSSVPRGIAMIPYFTFGNVKDVPTLMMYEPASYKETVTTKDNKTTDLTLTVKTPFPESEGAEITVNTSKSSTFPVALRVPSWCTSFAATVGNNTYKGIANQYVEISRLWKSGDMIHVSFKIPIQIIDGGKSYPGQSAFQRGPRILAFDDSLNMEFLKKIPADPDQKIQVEKAESKSNPALLPEQWIGKQAYSVSIIENDKSGSKHKFILVPFADAGQTGGAIKVWLPLILTEK